MKIRNGSITRTPKFLHVALCEQSLPLTLILLTPNSTTDLFPAPINFPFLDSICHLNISATDEFKGCPPFFVNRNPEKQRRNSKWTEAWHRTGRQHRKLAKASKYPLAPPPGRKQQKMVGNPQHFSWWRGGGGWGQGGPRAQRSSHCPSSTLWFSQASSSPETSSIIL